MAPKHASTVKKSAGSKASKGAGSSRKSAAKSISSDLPSVSKQTAGGIVGATLGGMVGGPVGAVVGGVAGAMVGNASAEGQRPIGTAVESIRSVAEKPIRKTVKGVANSISKKAAQAKVAATNAIKTTKKAATKLVGSKKGKGRSSKKAAIARH